MLTLEKGLLEKMFNYAKEEYPREACGILAGRDGKVCRVYQMENSDNSSRTYNMDSREQFRVFRDIRKREMQLSGIYHSHVASEAYPSARDKELAFYPEARYLIISLRNFEAPEIKAYKIRDGQVEEEKIEIV